MREKKNFGHKATVTMYIYTIIVAILQINNIIDALMWVIFLAKMCKNEHFFYF